MSALVPLLAVASAQLLAGSLFAVAGLGVCYAGVRTLRATLRRGDFEPVEATVLDSSLRVRDGGSTTTTYAPEIEYEYAVDGTTYTADSVYPGDVTGSDDREKHESVVQAHPDGATVEAFYDPADPTESFLVDTSTLSDGLLVLGSGIAMLVGGLFFVLEPLLGGLVA